MSCRATQLVDTFYLEPCAGRAAPPPPTFVSRRRRRRFVCIGAPTPPPPTFGRRAAEGLPLSGIFSYCIFHLLDLIAIYFKNQKITVELIDCKLQVATKCRSCWHRDRTSPTSGRPTYGER